MLAANRLFTARCLLGVASKQLHRQYSTVSRSFWPEPITQQTLKEFLDDIDYFEQPKKFINIGLRVDQAETSTATSDSQASVGTGSQELQVGESVNVDKLLDMLGQHTEPPELDLDDALISREQLKSLAITHGIYRDLFGDYKPRREQISFTTEQAERLAKLVPHYWISDQPRARADRHMKREPLVYFEPLVRVSAKFVHQNAGENECQAHSVYHGNIIPASEALVKPSIVLDCRDLPSTSDMKNQSDIVRDGQFNNWTPGQVTCENFLGSTTTSQYLSLLLLNLDYLHPDGANLHWMVANMKPSPSGPGTMAYEEVCDFLPVHGIRGFGYSRYVFLVVQHGAKIDANKINLPQGSRKFDIRAFIGRNKDINMTPVGLSWFQTTWDVSSNRVFHENLNMRSPVYEHVQEKFKKREMLDKGYPGKIPFNVFMDHYRDRKSTNESVLLERLKNIDPFDYKDQYVPPKVPPTVFVDENIPSWMSVVMFKKKNRIGKYRGLRPASATIPLNNNADLDYPIRPLGSSKKHLPGYPNIYEGRHITKALKDLPYSKPANEHPSVYVQDDHQVHLDQVRKMMKDLKEENIKR